MAFNVGDIVAHIKADVSDFNSGVSSVKSKITDVGHSITDFGKKVSLVSAAFAIPFTAFLKSASEEAMNLEKALVTLDIIAGRFGVSGEAAKKAAQDLGKELRIGVGSSAAGLQNLLKSGLNLEQATDLMKRFANEAITGKANSISMSQAVENLTFAYATNNSAIGNLSGVNENFMDIIEKGREALIKEGIAASTITDEMAKYRGMIDLTNLTMGSSERFHGTLIDKQAEMGQKVTDLKVAFGQLINPVLMQVVDWLTQLFNWVNSLNESQKSWILIVGALIVAIGPAIVIIGWLVSGIGILVGAIGTVGAAIAFLAFNPLVWIVVAIGAVVAAGVWLIQHWDEVKSAASRLGEWIGNIWNTLKDKIRNAASGIFNAMTQPFEDAWNKIKDLMNRIKDALDFTKRHSPSVVDIVNRGVKLVNNALDELPSDFAISPSIAMAGASNVGSGTIMKVNISMDGAIIADQAGAKRMAEMFGDLMIEKVKKNIRF